MSLGVMLVAPFSDVTHFDQEITSNLRPMAIAVGINNILWGREGAFAHELIEPLTIGIRTLQTTPVYFSSFEPSNKWGTVDSLLGFLTDLRNMCEHHPEDQVVRL